MMTCFIDTMLAILDCIMSIKIIALRTCFFFTYLTGLLKCLKWCMRLMFSVYSMALVWSPPFGFLSLNQQHYQGACKKCGRPALPGAPQAWEAPVQITIALRHCHQQRNSRLKNTVTASVQRLSFSGDCPLLPPRHASLYISSLVTIVRGHF